MKFDISELEKLISQFPRRASITISQEDIICNVYTKKNSPLWDTDSIQAPTIEELVKKIEDALPVYWKNYLDELKPIEDKCLRDMARIKNYRKRYNEIIGERNGKVGN